MTAEEEAGFVTGADLGYNHPDNVPTEPDVDAVPPEPSAEIDEDLLSEAELDPLVADVDVDEVDAVGFDDADLEEPLGTDLADSNRSDRGGS